MKKIRGVVSNILHKGCHEWAFDTGTLPEGTSRNRVGHSTAEEGKVERTLENDSFKALHACWL